MKSDLDKPYCKECGGELHRLGNSLKSDGINYTTYGFCFDCNNYRWSHPWYTELSNRDIIKRSIAGQSYD